MQELLKAIQAIAPNANGIFQRPNASTDPSSAGPCIAVEADGSYYQIDFASAPSPQQISDIGTLAAAFSFTSEPDWDGFAVWAMGNAALSAVFVTAQAVTPLAAAGLPTALLQVQSGNTVNFAAAWEGLCVAGGATAQQREEWAQVAEGYDLPADFVAIVRGQ